MALVKRQRTLGCVAMVFAQVVVSLIIGSGAHQHSGRTPAQHEPMAIYSIEGMHIDGNGVSAGS